MMDIRQPTKKARVYNQLQGAIVHGELPEGSRLPGVLQLSRDFQVSEITVRGALRLLSEAGYLQTRNGLGSFVISRQPTRKPGGRILILHTMSSGPENPDHYLFPPFFQSCSERGIQAECVGLDFIRQGRPEKMISLLRRKKYLGVLLSSSYFLGHEKELGILKSLSLPVVIPHGRKADYAATGFATLYTDTPSAWEEGIRHLRLLGHQRIALLLNDSLESFRHSSNEQQNRLLETFGASGEPALIKAVEYSFSSIDQAIRELLALPNPPTAIQCYSDFFALHACQSLKAAGVKIPEQISVLGFCGYPGGKLLSPPLSTVDVDYNGIGLQAAELLFSSEKWYLPGMPPPLIATPFHLASRGSTAVPAAVKEVKHAAG